MSDQFNTFDEKNNSLRENFQPDATNVAWEEFNSRPDEVRTPDNQFSSFDDSEEETSGGGQSDSIGSKAKNSKKSQAKAKEAEKKRQKTLKDKLKSIQQAGQKIIKMTILTVGGAATITVSSYASGGSFLPELSKIVEEYGGDFMEELNKPLVEPIEGVDSDIIISLLNTPGGDPELPGYVGDNPKYSNEDGSEEVAEVIPEETTAEETLPEETTEEETSTEETSEEETSVEETSETETLPEETSPEETTVAETTVAESSTEETTTVEETTKHSSGGGGSSTQETEHQHTFVSFNESKTRSGENYTNCSGDEYNEYGYEKCTECGKCFLQRGQDNEIIIDDENLLYDRPPHAGLTYVTPITVEGTYLQATDVSVGTCSDCGREIKVHFSALQDGYIEIYAYETIEGETVKSNPKIFGYSSMDTITVSGNPTGSVTAKEVQPSEDVEDLKASIICRLNRIKKCYITCSDSTEDFTVMVLVAAKDSDGIVVSRKYIVREGNYISPID